jgi:hypothetical protein
MLVKLGQVSVQHLGTNGRITIMTSNVLVATEGGFESDTIEEVLDRSVLHQAIEKGTKETKLL